MSAPSVSINRAVARKEEGEGGVPLCSYWGDWGSAKASGNKAVHKNCTSHKPTKKKTWLLYDLVVSSFHRLNSPDRK